MTIPPPPNALALLKEAGLFAKKSWGQNFLLDQSVLAEAARLAVERGGERVLELGAGLGALTYHLLAQGARVAAVERDREMVPLLTQALAWSNGLTIIEADAARLDYAELARARGGPLAVAGNLPYQLSSRILVSLADAWPNVERAVVLLQREVAERLTAPPDSRTYGLLSVLVGRSFSAHIARHVPPAAFHPRPKVHSALVVLDLVQRERDAAADQALVATARASFHSRRKTLRNSLSSGLAAEPAVVEQAILAAGLSPQARAETLSLADFDRLSVAVKERGLLVAR